MWFKSIGSSANSTALSFCFLIKISLPNRAQWAPAISSTCYVLECSIDVGWKTEKLRKWIEICEWKCRMMPKGAIHTLGNFHREKTIFESQQEILVFYLFNDFGRNENKKSHFRMIYKRFFASFFPLWKSQIAARAKKFSQCGIWQSCHFLMLLFQSS